jgi:hypothetical protein
LKIGTNGQRLLKFKNIKCKQDVKRSIGYMQKLITQNQVLLWFNIAENRNCATTYDRSLSYRILTTSVERFARYTEKSIYGLNEIQTITPRYDWKSELLDKLQWKSLIPNLMQICLTVYA